MYGSYSNPKEKPVSTEYYLHNQKLDTVSKGKYLDVILDPKLSFNHHVDATCKKANSVLAFIRRNLKHCHWRVKIDAYNSFVKSILNYAALAWTPHTATHINKLEVVQKHTARFIMSDYRRSSSVTKMLDSLKWKPVTIQYKELRLLMFYKIINKIVELYLPDYIIPAPQLQEEIVLNSYNQWYTLIHINITFSQVQLPIGTNYHQM